MKLFFYLCLVFFPVTLWGQSPLISSTSQSKLQGHPVNFGVKFGFTSALPIVSDLTISGTKIKEIQNNFKIGYLGSVFMRINFNRHFLQPEISYNINRCNITFNKSVEGDVTPEVASNSTFIHSIDVPVIYGYNIIKEGPYSLAIFGGPKIRYIWNKNSEITFENFDQQGIKESLYPLNISFTLGVAVTISRIFFDFRYDIGLHNISRRLTYDASAEGNQSLEDTPDEIRFNRRDNVLSFSFGVFF